LVPRWIAPRITVDTVIHRCPVKNLYRQKNEISEHGARKTNTTNEVREMVQHGRLGGDCPFAGEAIRKGTN